jgi:DNA-binding NtrC family response regulator
MARILIIDDEPAMVDAISRLCRDRGHQSFPYCASETALEALNTINPHLVIVDVKMEKVTGFDILRECHKRLPHTAVVMITAYASVESAVEAIKLGAFDYITKPFKIDELHRCITRALEYQMALRENSFVKRDPRERYKFENLIGTSAQMQAIYKLIGKIADTDTTVLIQGESGTGKELVARALHYNSSRQHHPFVAINCSALTETQLESELFGQKKGVFSGAVTDKIGSFEDANNGTLFLDEIHSMSSQLQTKLLRTLQERLVRRVGEVKPIPVNVRVIAASHEAIRAKIRTGGFREDLYYRLAVIPIDIPPLRERLEDIPLLVDHFLQRYSSQTATENRRLEPRSLERLVRYTWPGNVRELENVIERACTLSEEGVIKIDDLPPYVMNQTGSSSGADIPWQVGKHLDEFVRNQERKYIELTLKFNQGSREKTASMLGISIATLYRKLDLKQQRE